MDDVDTVDDDTDDEGTNAMDDGTGSGYGSGRAAPPSTPAAALGQLGQLWTSIAVEWPLLSSAAIVSPGDPGRHCLNCDIGI